MLASARGRVFRPPAAGNRPGHDEHRGQQRSGGAGAHPAAGRSGTGHDRDGHPGPPRQAALGAGNGRWSSGWARCGCSTASRSPSSARVGSRPGGAQLGASGLSAGQVRPAAAALYVAGAVVGSLSSGTSPTGWGARSCSSSPSGCTWSPPSPTAFSTSAAAVLPVPLPDRGGHRREYAAINSAIDELIPPRARGTVDLSINGSYWGGAGVGAALIALNTALFPAERGLAPLFALGALLGVGILIVRRRLPECPRPLFIHGRDEEAEALVEAIERRGRPLRAARRSRSPTGAIRCDGASDPLRREWSARSSRCTAAGPCSASRCSSAGVPVQRDALHPGLVLNTFFGVSGGVVRSTSPISAVGDLLGPPRWAGCSTPGGGRW